MRIPMVGTWKWKHTDFAIPLTFQLSGVRASLFLDDFAVGMRDRQIVWDARLRFEYASPTAVLFRSLRASGKLAKELADTLYTQYPTIHEQLEGVLRTAGGVVNLPLDSPMTFEEVFAQDYAGQSVVTWWHDGEERKSFKLSPTPVRRRINPLSKKDQILTTKKWQHLQAAIDNQEFPSQEILQLLRLRAQIEWRQRKLATIEAAILLRLCCETTHRRSSLGLVSARTRSRH